jgi:hypothetical protein
MNLARSEYPRPTRDIPCSRSETQGSPPQEANTCPMPEPRAQRTLVKSPPEIWAEVSDVSTLARHLGEFGEIRITRLEAETTVVWEGDRARGTVELEASGWGTKVTITAEAITTEEAEVVVEAEIVEAESEVAAEEAVAEEADDKDAAPIEAEVVAEEIVEKDAAPIEAEVVAEVIETEPAAETPAPEPRRGLFARLRRRRRTAGPVAEPIAIEPEIMPAVAAPEPVAEVEVEVEEITDAVEVADAVEVPEAVELPEAIELPEAPEIAEPVLDGEITASATAASEITASATAATDALDPERVEAVLVGVLDDLGAAHHRPFSRG